jgi:hypothetical protein
LSDDARRPEGQGVTGARLVSSYRGHLPGDGQRITAGYSDVVEVPGHVALSREAAVAGELIQIHHGECGTVVGIVYWPELSTATIFTLPQALSNRPEHESQRQKRESVCLSPAARCIASVILCSLLYHGNH